MVVVPSTSPRHCRGVLRCAERYPPAVRGASGSTGETPVLRKRATWGTVLAVGVWVACTAAATAPAAGEESAMKSKEAQARVSRLVEANVIGTHAFQVRLAAGGKGDAACWSARGLSDEALKALVEHQRSLLSAKPEAVRAWAEGKTADFEAARHLEAILASPLKASDGRLPVNVYTDSFRAKTKADALACRAAASLLQMMLDIDRDGDMLQDMFAQYTALGLPVHTAALGMPQTTDEQFLAVARDLSAKMCPSPFATDGPAVRILFRKMWNWGHRYTRERDAHTVATELLAEPDIRAALPKVRAMGARKIAVIGHSFTMNVHWSSPSAFVPIVIDMLKQTNPKVEVRLWQAGGLNPARADCQRFFREVLQWKPAAVLIVVAGHGPRDAAALDKMAAGFAEAGIEAMTFDRLSLGEQRAGVGAKVLEGLAARHGVVLIEVGPLLSASPDRDRFVCLDGLHMTEPWHRLMAKQWLMYLAGARTAKLRGGK